MQQPNPSEQCGQGYPPSEYLGPEEIIAYLDEIKLIPGLDKRQVDWLRSSYFSDEERFTEAFNLATAADNLNLAKLDEIDAKTVNTINDSSHSERKRFMKVIKNAGFIAFMSIGLVFGFGAAGVRTRRNLN